jgi:hypothetical protein
MQHTHSRLSQSESEMSQMARRSPRRPYVPWLPRAKIHQRARLGAQARAGPTIKIAYLVLGDTLRIRAVMVESARGIR